MDLVSEHYPVFLNGGLSNGLSNVPWLCTNGSLNVLGLCTNGLLNVPQLCSIGLLDVPGLCTNELHWGRLFKLTILPCCPTAVVSRFRRKVEQEL